MHLKIPAAPFAAAAGSAVRVVSDKSSLPILRNILLEAQDNSLRVVASDLETTLDITLPAQVETQGTFSVTGKALAELVSKLGNNELSVQRKGQQLHLSCCHGDYTLPGMDGDEYPAITNPSVGNPCTLEATLLREVLAHVVGYPDKLATSAGYNCVRLLAAPGSLLCSAMLRDQLYARRLLALPSFSGQYQALVPVQAAREIAELLKGDPGSATVYADEHQLTVAVSATKLTTRLLEGGYPNMEGHLGKLETPFALIFNRDALLQSMRRLLIVAEPNTPTHRVRFEADFDNVTLTSETPYGKVVETLAPEAIDGDGEPFCMNALLLQRVLSALSCERVALRYADGIKTPLGIMPAEDTGRETATWIAKMTHV